MPGVIPESTLEQIRAASDIVEIISSSFPLKRAGANFVALCPFHREKSPSFNVNPQKQIFYCFGCHKGGDVFSFVQAYENISFLEAVRRLAERARIPLAFAREGGEKTQGIKTTLLEIHEQLTVRWHRNLLADAGAQIAREYLDRRAVPEDAIKRFRLGYAPDLWDDTVNWARSKGHPLPLIQQGGLIIERDQAAGQFYDRFRGRLMFPIADEQGRVIGFSGRILTDEKQAKYVNSPETPIFVKGKIIFGLDKAKRALLEAKQAIVCEGQLDLIRCHTSGIENVVAPQGTALTADQIRVLKRYVTEVLLCFDSDRAGRAAAIRALDELLASGLAIRVVEIPPPHDPDSFIKEHGAEAFRGLVTGARSFFDFYLDELSAQNDPGTDAGKAAIVARMGEALQKAGNAVWTDAYSQKTAGKIGVSADSVRQQFARGNSRARPAASEAAGEAEAPASAPRPPAAELWLLKLLLLDESLLPQAALLLDTAWIQDARVREIIAARIHLHRDNSWTGLGGFLSHLGDDEERSLAAEAGCEGREIPHRPQQLLDLIRRMRDQFYDRTLVQLQHQLSDPSLPDARKVELLRWQTDLREKKKQPLG